MLAIAPVQVVCKESTKHFANEKQIANEVYFMQQSQKTLGGSDLGAFKVGHLIVICKVG